MTPEIQSLVIRKYNLWWSLNAKRMKKTMRSRLRWGEEMWNKNVDQCALAMYVAKEARQDARVSPEMIDNMLQGFMGGLLVSWIICQFL